MEDNGEFLLHMPVLQENGELNRWRSKPVRTCESHWASGPSQRWAACANAVCLPEHTQLRLGIICTGTWNAACADGKNADATRN